jgi:glutamate decarboxylase
VSPLHGCEHGPGSSDLADRLRTHDWLVPAGLQAQTVQRVLIRHGFSRDLGTHVIADLRRELATLERHPPAASMTEAEAGGFSHDARPAA